MAVLWFSRNTGLGPPRVCSLPVHVHSYWGTAIPQRVEIGSGKGKRLKYWCVKLRDILAICTGDTCVNGIKIALGLGD